MGRGCTKGCLEGGLHALASGTWTYIATDNVVREERREEIIIGRKSFRALMFLSRKLAEEERVEEFKQA